ncbi:MAG: hypothetical protein DRJ35_05015 [Thermoprotei archaeon]|nr:MAG: hypothetical protein DRJ35_05015 [Thermoprotei archaeon]
MNKKGKARITGIKKKLSQLYITGYSIEELRKISLEIILIEQYLKDLKTRETKEMDIIEDMLKELEEAKLIIYRMFTASKIRLSQKRKKPSKR